MSISNALNNAALGLSAAQSMSQVTSGNVANAMTSGYARREVVLVSTPNGGGAIVTEIRREVDESLTRLSRRESGKMARYQAINEGLEPYTAYLGQPGDGATMSEKFSEFNTSLTTLVNMPSSTGAQAAAVYAAEELAESIKGASDTLATVRADVDMEIRYELADLNQALVDLAGMNQNVQRVGSGTYASAAFSDKMDQILDDISGYMDIRTTTSSDGWVSLYTANGTALVEGNKVYDVTYNPGDSSLYAGGLDITPGKAGVRGIEQGSLTGFIELQRETVPQFQLQLDEYARGLMEAFEDSDASLAVGDAGLFTDHGRSYDAARQEGLAGRLQVNEAVSQTAGGQVWRIRDGMSASAEGDVADSEQIQSFISALDDPVDADPDTGFVSTVTVAAFVTELMTSQAAERSRAESEYNTTKSAAEIVQASRENAQGVSIDEEMQQLMLIEQSFAANSKILTAVGEMLDTLLAAV